mgnify:CR=1 FL=1
MRASVCCGPLLTPRWGSLTVGRWTGPSDDRVLQELSLSQEQVYHVFFQNLTFSADEMEDALVLLITIQDKLREKHPAFLRVQSLEPVLYAIADYLMFCREDPDSVQAVQELVSMIVEEVNQCAPIAEALDLLEKCEMDKSTIPRVCHANRTSSFGAQSPA